MKTQRAGLISPRFRTCGASLSVRPAEPGPIPVAPSAPSLRRERTKTAHAAKALAARGPTAPVHASRRRAVAALAQPKVCGIGHAALGVTRRPGASANRSLHTSSGRPVGAASTRPPPRRDRRAHGRADDQCIALHAPCAGRSQFFADAAAGRQASHDLNSVENAHAFTHGRNPEGRQRHRPTELRAIRVAHSINLLLIRRLPPAPRRESFR